MIRSNCRQRFLIFIGGMAVAGLLVCYSTAPFLSMALAASNTDRPVNSRIKISADKLTSRQNSNTAQFSGNVTAIYKGIRINSDALTIHYKIQSMPAAGNKTKGPVIKKIIASGHVKIKMDDDRTAVCEHAEYTPDTGVIILSGGNPEIKSAKNHIAGKEITINRNTGEITVMGSARNRVEAVFQSKGEELMKNSEMKKTGE